MKLSELEKGTPYAGIGSRETPEEILNLIEKIAFKLSKNLTLRSGGAQGADEAFYCGAVKNPKAAIEIFFPWENFANISPHHTILVKNREIIQQSEEIAAEFHGGWNSLTQGARRLMTRNTFQVLGDDLNSPSKFVLCWTQDGADGKKIKTSRNTGGTGQAIRIAAAYNIPVINLFNDMQYFKWSEWVK